ncbi:hypothetical protein [Dysgonomonas macrotermitis]|nr:hypothetical protein [Dysgonomonas macrotermitis]
MMNTRCFILLGFLCFSVLGYSQSDKLEIGLNFETSHVIEGQVISDMPTVEGYLKYRVVPSFVITGEGRAAIAEKNGSHYKEILWSLAYEKPRLYLALFSIYNFALDPDGNYFNFSKKKTNHFLEIITIGKPFRNNAFTINYNVYILGKHDLRYDSENKAKQQYTSYLEFSYPFTAYDVAINPFVGSGFALNGAKGHYTVLTVGDSGSHFNGFRVVNVGVSLSKDIKIGNYKIPLTISPNFNPSGQYAHVQVKIKLL